VNGGRAAAAILVVEDEANLADSIRENLEAEGYAVEVARNGIQGLEKVRERDWDLVLLDVMMPGLDGFSLCETARAEGNDVPVLFLTAKSSVDDRIRGLEAGGDDYLPKPFHLRELLLRVEAILRRRTWYGTIPAQGSLVRFGENEVDLSNYRGVSWDGKTQDLTQKEAMILKVLVEQAGDVVSRERILDKVWGYELFPSTRTIDNFIVRLRRRFEKDPESPRHFHTVRGVGYRFTPEEEAPR
jgi:two-component system alkaline phosphatase synthesis response regulator PhoP